MRGRWSGLVNLEMERRLGMKVEAGGYQAEFEGS